MRQIGKWSRLVSLTGLCVLGACAGHSPLGIFGDSTKDCAEMLLQRNTQTVAKTREQLFLGKVSDTTARCLGGKYAENIREGSWLVWPNYWAAGDATSLAPERFLANARMVGPNAQGIYGALYELELQRIELIKFNLFDNNKTYEWVFSTGRPVFSAVAAHEVEENGSGIYVGAPRQPERRCMVAPALEQLSVPLARLHEGARMQILIL